MKKWISTLFAALVALVGAPMTPAHADSAEETLINMLLEKKILSQEEAAVVLGELEENKSAEAEKMKKIPDKGTIVSGKYGKKHTLGGYTQADAHFGDSVLRTPDNTAEIRRARLALEGQIIDPITYKVQIDAAANSGILRDAKLSYKAMDELVFNAGQFKTPFSLEGLTSSSVIDTIERSRFVNALYPERQIGGSLSGKLFDGFLEYEAGAFNGNGINTRNDDNNFLYIGKASVVPFKGKVMDQNAKVKIGVSLATSEDTNANLGEAGFPRFVGERDLWGIDGTLELGPVAVKGEYINADLDFDGIPGRAANPVRFTPAVAAIPPASGEVDGFNVIGTLFLIPKKLQAVGKYEDFNNDFDSEEELEAVTVGLNWFFTEYDPKKTMTKLMVNWVHATKQEGKEDDQVFARFQVGY